MKRRNKKTGFAVFFTGLSGAGKSSLADLLADKLSKQTNKNIVRLDGDDIRKIFLKNLGFTKKDRDINIKFIGIIAKEIINQNAIAVCSAIAPYRKTREYIKKIIKKNGDFIEIYVSTPIAICSKRDSKGLYKNNKLGIIKNLTGVDHPYEPPLNPHFKINNAAADRNTAIENVILLLKKRKLI